MIQYMIQYHVYVLNQILFLSFYNLELYNNNIYMSFFSFRVLLPYPLPSKDRKNVAAEFPGAIRWTFCRGGEVNRSHSTDPSGFCLEEEEERGVGKGETISDGRQEDVARVVGCWKNGQLSQASASADVEFTLFHPLFFPFDLSFPCTGAPPANSKSH